MLKFIILIYHDRILNSLSNRLISFNKNIMAKLDLSPLLFLSFKKKDLSSLFFS